MLKGTIKRNIFFRFIFILMIIFFLCIFQWKTFGFVSYPGVFALIVKIALGMFTLIYFKMKKIDFLDLYIKSLTFLTIISLPFFLLNKFIHFGIPVSDSGHVRSLMFYTSFDLTYPFVYWRNSGMFWEPGAFSGYLLLALVFIVLKNRSFQTGAYKKDVFWITIGILSSMSTTGYIIFGIIILLFSFQNKKRERIFVIPATLIIIIGTYSNLDFLQNKIGTQYKYASNMTVDDISNTRMGSLVMDLQYIKSHPLIGNGLDIKTRFRFHPWIKEDFGHGNGMSNFIAYWGVPFFLLWAYGVYLFCKTIAIKRAIAIYTSIIILLILQGEQFLNYPLFLSFYLILYIYKTYYHNVVT